MRREYGSSTRAGELKLNVAIHGHMGCEVVADKNVRLTTLGVNAVPGTKPRAAEDGPLVFLIRVCGRPCFTPVFYISCLSMFFLSKPKLL